MKVRNIFSILFCLVLATALYAAAADSSHDTDQGTPAEVQWMRYDEGLAKAKAEDKHVMVDFSTGWCVYCKKMDKETFTKPDVIKLLNDNFVSIRVDGDSKEMLDIDGYKISEKDLTKKEFNVRGYPAFWFLKPDGTKLAMINGYRPSDYMIEALNYIKDKKYDTTNADTQDEEARLAAIKADWPEDIKSAIVAKKIMIGMSPEQAELAWGHPEDIKRTTTATGTSEQWVYAEDRYLYFEDGVLTTIQE